MEHWRNWKNKVLMKRERALFDGTTRSFSMWTVRACSRMPAVHYYIFQHPLSLAGWLARAERRVRVAAARTEAACACARPHFPCHRANISMIMPNACTFWSAHEHTGIRLWPRDSSAACRVHARKWIHRKDVRTDSYLAHFNDPTGIVCASDVLYKLMSALFNAFFMSSRSSRSSDKGARLWLSLKTLGFHGCGHLCNGINAESRDRNFLPRR